MSKELFENIKNSIHPSDELVEKTITRLKNKKEERSLRFRTLATCVIIACLITSTLVIYNRTESDKLDTTIYNSDDAQPVVKRVCCDSVIDVYNPNKVVGFADYVFVGYVNEQTGTEYKGSRKDRPYTNYSITIIKNIKGTLKQDEPISVQKHGGLSKDKSVILLAPDDELPKKEILYIFTGLAQTDGSLLIYGSNSNIALESNINKENLDVSEIVKIYENAFANQIDYERQRFISIYDDSSSESK